MEGSVPQIVLSRSRVYARSETLAVRERTRKRPRPADTEAGAATYPKSATSGANLARNYQTALLLFLKLQSEGCLGTGAFALEFVTRQLDLYVGE